MKRYGYHRTSTREQHLDRGIKEITAYCEQNNLELEKIFTDQQTSTCQIPEFDNDLVRRLISTIKVESREKLLIQFQSGIVMEQEIRYE